MKICVEIFFDKTFRDLLCKMKKKRKKTETFKILCLLLIEFHLEYFKQNLAYNSISVDFD